MSGKIKVMSTLLMLIVLILSTISASALEFETRSTVADLQPQDPADPLNTGSLPAVDVMFVKVNGDIVENGRVVKEVVDRGQILDISVKLEAGENIQNLKVMAWISGDEHYPLSEFSDSFDLDKNDRKSVDFELEVPSIVDQDSYELRIIVAARDGATLSYNYPLKINAQSHAFRIKDVAIYPTEVSPGRTFNTIARLQNLGEKDEEGVKVTVSIPELSGAMNSDYIDTVETDDEVSSEEIYIKVPADAKPGIYDVVIEAEYDEYAKSVKAVTQIEVVGDPKTTAPADGQETGREISGKTIVTVGPDSQDIVKGQGGAIYPLSLSNEGSSPKTYSISVGGADGFASTMIKPTNVITIDPDEAESAYIYLAAKENALEGSYGFTIDINSAGKTIKQIPLTANVVKAPDEQKSKWKKIRAKVIKLKNTPTISFGQPKISPMGKANLTSPKPKPWPRVKKKSKAKKIVKPAVANKVNCKSLGCIIPAQVK